MFILHRKQWAALWLSILLLGMHCGCTSGESIQQHDTESVQAGALPYMEQTPVHLHLPQQETQSPVIAAWLPYFQYPSLFEGKTEQEARAAVRALLTSAAGLGINTIFAHACAFGEAYYSSECYPMADTAQGFDYLQILSEECAAQSLSLHAWINPLRLEEDTAVSSWSNTTPIAAWYQSADTKGSYVVQVDDRWYLNPAYEEVRTFLCDAAAELLCNYDIDGIHIDDYFYPTTEVSFDAEAFARSGETSLAQWRRENVNTLLQMLYETVHCTQEDAVFSVSPSGKLAYNTETLYADCALWCSEKGYCDWLIPQIYYGYENDVQPFTETLAEWTSLEQHAAVRLVIGLAAYKVGAVDVFAGSGSLEWQEQQGLLAKQVRDAMQSARETHGIALYHLDTLITLSATESDAVKKAISEKISDSFYASGVS